MIVFDEDFTLLDLGEVARALGISRFRVEDYVRVGTLAAVHHGGKWMVAADELERFRRAWDPQPPVPRTMVPRRFRPPSRP